MHSVRYHHIMIQFMRQKNDAISTWYDYNYIIQATILKLRGTIIPTIIIAELRVFHINGNRNCID